MMKFRLAVALAVVAGALTACGGAKPEAPAAPEASAPAAVAPGHEGHAHDAHGHEAGGHDHPEGVKCEHGVTASMCAECAPDSGAASSPAVKCEHGVVASTCERCKGHAH